METSAYPGSPGIGLGCAGFSSNPVMRHSSSTSTIPKPEAPSILTGSTITVASASFARCSSIIWRMFIRYMICSKDRDEFWIVPLDQVEVLTDCIGCSLVPLVACPHLGRNSGDEAVANDVGKAPGSLDVI